MKTGQYAQYKSASQKSRQQDPTTKFALVCTKYALRCVSRREIRYVPRAVDRNPQVPPTGNAPANWCLSLRVQNYLSLRTSPLKWCGNPLT